jgi:adenosylcobinamide hydrolase
MKNVSIKTESYRDLEVTSIVTAGIEVNGGRAGDPASYYQEDGRFEKIGGTIISIVLIGADLPSYSLVRAAMTATEAKTCALQQLMAPSRYSDGIATGSGTDMVAIVSNGESKLKLTDSGKHSKLGEMIGNTVLNATIEALDRQSDLNAHTQMDLLIRLERYHKDERDIWRAAFSIGGENRRSKFNDNLAELRKDPLLVASTGAILHICDEVSWGLIPEASGKKTALSLMGGIGHYACPSSSIPLDRILSERDTILDNWIRIIAWIIKNGRRGEQHVQT